MIAGRELCAVPSRCPSSCLFVARFATVAEARFAEEAQLMLVMISMRLVIAMLIMITVIIVLSAIVVISTIIMYSMNSLTVVITMIICAWPAWASISQ